ncbi:MAG: hypothetical protein WA951_05895 [Leeuwenhoekiella sp.]
MKSIITKVSPPHNDVHLPKTIHFIFIFVILCSSKLVAQQTVVLQGQVLNDSIGNAYLHIVNLTTQQGTITNEGGAFTIPVHLQDTLYISAVQLENMKVVITPEIFSRKQIEIRLKDEVNDLPQVTVSDINLSGMLGLDSKNSNVEKPFDPAAAGLPVYTGPTLTQEERQLYTAQHSANGIVSVDAVLNALSGRTKMLQKRVELSNMERRVQSARRVMSDSMYTKILDIPPALIDDFVHFVFEGKEWRLKYAEDNNVLALIEMLQELAPEYLEIKREQ